jgi:hypothetical protein
MDNGNWLVDSECFLQEVSVEKISFDEWAPPHCISVAIDQIIISHWYKTSLSEHFTGVAAYITRTTGYQDLFFHIL